MEIKTVTIIGVGAVGAVIASKLAKYLGKENVQCIADGERKARYERDFLYLNGEKQDFIWTESKNAKKTDLVIIATKNLQLEQAIESIKNAVGSNTVIISLLNGIQSERDIANVFGKEHVLYSFMLSINSIHEKNHIDYSNDGCMFLGEEDNSKTERLEAICKLLKAANINYKVPEDIKLEQWKKYLLNVTFNTLSAICRSTYGGFRFPVMQNLARKVGAEVVCIANKLDIALTMDMLEYDIKLMCSHDPFGKTSMLQDMEAERKSENAWFCGTIVKLGKELSIPTPTCELLEMLVEGTEKVRELKANQI